MSLQRPALLLLTLVVAQFCGTALWFATNAVMDGLTRDFGLPAAALGYLTSAVQGGFIAGTLVFSLLAVADRFSPSAVFASCAGLAAAATAAATVGDQTLLTLLLGRFTTGFFLAGIYPVGMKIAADHYGSELGRALGWLVGALVVGTALPHGLRALEVVPDWRSVVLATSGLAILGGGLLFVRVPDGPHRRPGRPLRWAGLSGLFSQRDFRAAALGYFGHMWELYAFWTFVPVLLGSYFALHPTGEGSVAAGAFLTIAVGGPACVVGSRLARRYGTRRVARAALLLSGTACLLCPVVVRSAPLPVFVGFLGLWGAAVVADSPLFSTLVARHAPATSRGTALTLVTCLGYAISVGSIELVSWLTTDRAVYWVLPLLAVGPALGWWCSRSVAPGPDAPETHPEIKSPD